VETNCKDLDEKKYRGFWDFGDNWNDATNYVCGLQIENLDYGDFNNWRVEVQRCKNSDRCCEPMDHVVKDSIHIYRSQKPKLVTLSSPTIAEDGEVETGSRHRVTCQVRSTG